MAARSHPPALLRRTARTLREETSLERGDAVIVAVSGGGDSMALLHVLSWLAPKLGVTLHAHGVDHGLRAEAVAELSLAAECAHRLGVPFARSRVSVEPGGNLQARARAARYAALDAAAKQAGARWVATAHHADDRAETVLLRLLRGAGVAGLGVLPACSPGRSTGRLRPLARSPRSAVVAHLERHGLRWAEDPSNRDRRFLRSRVRHELLPLLDDLSSGVRDHLCALADEVASPTTNHAAADDPRADDDARADDAIVTDEQGTRLRLGREHRRQIHRARKFGRAGARIWLPGGLELTVGKAREPLVASAAPGVDSPVRNAARSAARNEPSSKRDADSGAETRKHPKKPSASVTNCRARGAKDPKSD